MRKLIAMRTVSNSRWSGCAGTIGIEALRCDAPIGHDESETLRIILQALRKLGIPKQFCLTPREADFIHINFARLEFFDNPILSIICYSRMVFMKEDS